MRVNDESRALFKGASWLLAFTLLGIGGCENLLYKKNEKSGAGDREVQRAIHINSDELSNLAQVLSHAHLEKFIRDLNNLREEDFANLKLQYRTNVEEKRINEFLARINFQLTYMSSEERKTFLRFIAKQSEPEGILARLYSQQDPETRERITETAEKFLETKEGKDFLKLLEELSTDPQGSPIKTFTPFTIGIVILFLLIAVTGRKKHQSDFKITQLRPTVRIEGEGEDGVFDLGSGGRGPKKPYK